MYEMLLFNLYKNLSPSSFFLSSRGGSFTSTCSVFTGEVLKAPVYIIMHSLYMLSSFFNLPAEAVLYSPFLSYILHCTDFLRDFRSPNFFLVLFALLSIC